MSKYIYTISVSQKSSKKKVLIKFVNKNSKITINYIINMIQYDWDNPNQKWTI